MSTPTPGIGNDQIKDAAVERHDLNTSVPGQAVAERIVAGSGITLSSTGVDTGTGDVTVSVAAASQAGWNAATAEVIAARTRTVKGVSSTSLEGRLDAMEADIVNAGNGTTPGSPGAVPAATASAFGTVETDITESGGSVVYTKTTLDSLLAGKISVGATLMESEISGLLADLGNKITFGTSLPESEISGLISDLAGKIASGSALPESEISGLLSDLAGKMATGAVLPESEIASLAADLAARLVVAGTASLGQVPVVTGTSPLTVGWQTPQAAALTVAEALGSGADAPLAAAYQAVPNLSLMIAAGQVASVSGIVEVTADPGASGDDFYAQLYDAAQGTAIPNSERHISSLLAGKRGQITVSKFVPASPSARSLVIQVKNGTQARGTVSAAASLLEAITAAGGSTSGGTVSAPPKPPAGAMLKTSGNSLLSGLVFALPLNEGAGTTMTDAVSGTAATLNAGWGWGTDTSGQTVLVNSSSTTEAALFSGVTMVLGSFTVVALYTANSASYSAATFFGQGDNTGANWNLSMDNRTEYDTFPGGTVSGLPISGMATAAFVRLAGTSVSAYNLSGGTSALLGSGSDSGGSLRSGATAGWHIGGGYLNGQRYLAGSMKGVFIWNRGLTSAELSSLAADPWQMFTGY